MKITMNGVAELNPCEDRFDNFKEKYPNYDGDLKDFVLLENITYSDKVWVFTRLATHRQNVKWSLLCASRVLSKFETVYPDDKRPRQALEAVENWLNNPNEEAAAEAAEAAWSAARSAARSAAGSAEAAEAAWSAAGSARSAEAATWSARSAVWSAWSAAGSARSARSAAGSAEAAARWAAAGSDEEHLNLLMMVEALKND